MSPSRVLVVEDNHEVRRMVTASIKTLGDDIEVLDVPSAEEALVVSASKPLDLLVLDIRLPGMSGMDMFTRLRIRKPGIKVILVTGVDDEGARRQVSEARADACFFKPIDIQVFLEAVKRLLSTAQPLTPTPARPAARPIIHPPVSSTTRPAPISLSHAAARKPAKDAAEEEPPLTIRERLISLKKQLKAVAALLVNDAGQILEEAGTAADIATGSPLLLALMRAFRASLQVSQAMARGTSESLQYFTAPRQCVYVAPVGQNHCLFVVTSGYFGPDKLGMLYHAIHLAVCDLQGILAIEDAVQKAIQHPEAPPVVAVDKDTLARVEGIFSQATKAGSRERADGFWENVEHSGAADSTPAREILSYDQARDLGLAPSGGEDGTAG